MSESIELSYLSGQTRVEVDHYFSELGNEWRTKIRLTPAGSGTTFVFTIEEAWHLFKTLGKAAANAQKLQEGRV